eukprot:667163-Amphidinium_carterae.1
MAFALQKPILLCCKVVRPLTSEEKDSETSTPAITWAAKAYAHDVVSFEAMPGTDFGESWAVDKQYERIEVFMNCQYNDRGHLCTLEPSQYLEVVLQALPCQRG